MHSSRLALAGRLLVALLAMFAFSGIAAAAAQAEEPPRWIIEGKNLAQGQTHYITAKGYATKAKPGFTLTVIGLTVLCESMRLKEGVILGSSSGNPGMNSEALEIFGNCKLTGNGANCKVREPIVTNNVKSELVESGQKGNLLTEFFSEKEGVFLKFEFIGSECKTGNPSEVRATGEIAAEVLTDPNNGELGEKVEAPSKLKEAKSWLLNFPETPIRNVWLIKGGLGETAKTELLAFALYATLTGTALVSLAKKTSKGELEAEETKWSFQ